MPTERPVPLSALLDGRGMDECSRLVQQARHSAALSRSLREVLPVPLAGHCEVGRLDGATLVLVTDSPVWAARLRYHIPQLRAHFSERHHARLRDVKIRIHPPALPGERPPARRLHLSQGNAALLRDTARAVSDPKLAAALLRLASAKEDCG